MPEDSALYLDIPSVLSAQISKSPSPRVRMGKRARRSALRLGGCFAPAEESRAVFVTGTLPGSTPAALETFAANSSNVVNWVQKAIAGWHRKRGLKVGKYLWVWEPQKRGALHLHMCLEFPDSKLAQKFLQYWAKLWATVLKKLAARESEVIFERLRGGTWAERPDVWQTDAEIVEKDVCRYMSKYLSKDLHQGIELPPELAPHGRWWGCSHSLREALNDFIAKNTIYLPIELDGDEDMEMIGECLKSLIEGHSDGTAKDVSPWFQEHTKAVFGYLRDGVDFVGVFIAELLETFQFIKTNKPSAMGWPCAG